MSHSTSSSSSTDNNGLPWEVLLSAGVFCLTVWGTQWILLCQDKSDQDTNLSSKTIDKKIETNHNDIDNRNDVDADCGGWYEHRQLKHRLSFYHSFDENDTIDHSNHTVKDKVFDGYNDDDVIPPVTPMPADDGCMSVDSLTTVSAASNNWNHFEHYNENGQRQRQLYEKTHSACASLGGDRLFSDYDKNIAQLELNRTDSSNSREFSTSRKQHHQKRLPTIPSEERIKVDKSTSSSSSSYLAPKLSQKSAEISETVERNNSRQSLTQKALSLFRSFGFTDHVDKEGSGLVAQSKSLPPLSCPDNHDDTKASLHNSTLDRNNNYNSNDNSNDHYTQGFCKYNRMARAAYNARVMPHKLVLIRHGQSMGNLDEHLFSTTPDNAMQLTRLGWDQAKHAGQLLRHKILADASNVHFIVSPYVRTVETMHGIFSAWCDPKDLSHVSDPNDRRRAWYQKLYSMGLTWHQDPRIREQDFGNYQQPAEIRRAKRERQNFGAFYYRFPHGESASDVYDRISTFLDSLWRSFDMSKNKQYVIVTHGIAIRVLLTRYFRYTIDQFHLLSNPRNCEMVVLQHDGYGRLKLSGRYELHYGKDDESDETVVMDYQYYPRLSVLPEQYVKEVKIRMNYEEESTSI